MRVHLQYQKFLVKVDPVAARGTTSRESKRGPAGSGRQKLLLVYVPIGRGAAFAVEAKRRLAAGEQGLRYYATGDQVGVSQSQPDKLLLDGVWEEVELGVQAVVQNRGVRFQPLVPRARTGVSPGCVGAGAPALSL